jgi:NitT/TauT family transport system substrate-binding protein
MKQFSLIKFLLAFSMSALIGLSSMQAQAKEKFKFAWTIYAGWMPWAYAQQEGIIKKWADKYGIEIDVTQVNDYIESINQYTAGKFDACLMTNMDALTIPAAGGVDTTSVIMGDYSNGNDAIVLKNKDKLSDIKGQHVNLVEFSVSHYILARALSTVGLSERDLTLVNTSDADIVAAYKSPDVTAAVLWNPQLGQVMQSPDAHEVFNSSQIPGEILDLAMVHTEVMKKHPEFVKALVGAWYETMTIMHKGDAKAEAALSMMAKASGTDLAGYKKQLATTYLYETPAKAVKYTRSKKLIKAMDLVRKFSFDHGILGEAATSPDYVGIEFPGGKVLGDKKNIKLRFDDTFAEMAAKGQL